MRATITVHENHKVTFQEDALTCAVDFVVAEQLGTVRSGRLEIYPPVGRILELARLLGECESVNWREIRRTWNDALGVDRSMRDVKRAMTYLLICSHRAMRKRIREALVAAC